MVLFLYQSIITILIWWIIIIDYLYLLPFCYYNKLGSGIGGYYIPNLYYNILNYKYGINLLIYIGISNIILMYNPIFLFSNINSINYNNNITLLLLIINFIFIISILFIWIYNGYLFINNWLYSISFSTIILSNIFYLFISYIILI